MNITEIVKMIRKHFPVDLTDREAVKIALFSAFVTRMPHQTDHGYVMNVACLARRVA